MLGLGLSMVEGVIKQSGGHIEVLSTPGADQAFARNLSGPIALGSYVFLSVKDSGEGMPPEVAPHFRAVLYHEKVQPCCGSLGLSMVEGVIKQSGGHIEVLSTPGAGTEFQIYLPRIADKIVQ